MTNDIANTSSLIDNRIFTFRGEQVMIVRDLANLYQVEVKRLNEPVKSNIGRFSETFRFQLHDTENNELVANSNRFGAEKSIIFVKFGN